MVSDKQSKTTMCWGMTSFSGYDKKDCVLTVNEEEAKIVRTVFDFYGNKGLGICLFIIQR